MQRAEEARRLEPGLALLILGNGVVEQRRASRVSGDSVLQVHGSDGDASVDVAVERQQSERAAVPAAWILLQIFHGLGRRLLGSAGHGDGPHLGQESVERIEALVEDSLNVIHGVEQPRIALDQPAADHFYRAGRADARLVVAVDVGAHRQLGLFFGRVEQCQDQVVILQRVARAARRPGDRAALHPPALDAQEHLGRSAHQLFVAELQQKLVRAWRAALHAAEEFGRTLAESGGEALTQDHLIEVALLHAGAHSFDLRHVLFRRVVGDDFGRRRGGRNAHFRGVARQPGG